MSLLLCHFQVLAELKEYATEVDVDFVRKAVRAIGRCAIKVEVRNLLIMPVTFWWFSCIITDSWIHLDVEGFIRSASVYYELGSSGLFFSSNQLSAVSALCWTWSRPRSTTWSRRPLWSLGTSSASTPTSRFPTEAMRTTMSWHELCWWTSKMQTFIFLWLLLCHSDVFRYESIIATLCENLDSLDEPDARAAMIWIVGEYAERIDNADELLESFLEGFHDESTQVGFSSPVCHPCPCPCPRPPQWGLEMILWKHPLKSY